MIINEDIVKCLDEQFPKGDKSRGKALVLQAIAHNELQKQAKAIFEAIENEYPFDDSCICLFHIKKLRAIKEKFLEFEINPTDNEGKE